MNTRETRFLENFGAKTLGSTACITGPGRFREVWEASSKNSVLPACRNSGMVNSYDQKTKQDHEYSIHAYFSSLSVVYHSGLCLRNPIRQGLHFSLASSR